MASPRLLHPLPTEIQSVNTAATIQDHGYNEPVQGVAYEPAYTIPGQWRWLSDRDLRMEAAGAAEHSSGYVVLRVADLRAMGKQIKRGDRIVAYGSGPGRVELDVYVVRLRYEGHYGDQGGATLVKAFFSDRQPERQRPGA